MPLQRGEVSWYLFAESGGRAEGGGEEGEKRMYPNLFVCPINFLDTFSPVIDFDNEQRLHREAMQPKQKVKASLSKC